MIDPDDGAGLLEAAEFQRLAMLFELLVLPLASDLVGRQQIVALAAHLDRKVRRALRDHLLNIAAANFGASVDGMLEQLRRIDHGRRVCPDSPLHRALAVAAILHAGGGRGAWRKLSRSTIYDALPPALVASRQLKSDYPKNRDFSDGQRESLSVTGHSPTEGHQHVTESRTDDAHR